MISKMLKDHAILREISNRFQLCPTHMIENDSFTNVKIKSERRIIPIKQVNYNVLACEFNNMKQLFEQELMKIDGEMNKFAKYFNQISTGYLFPGSGQPVPGCPGGVHISRNMQEAQDVFESFGRWSCGHGKEDDNGYPLVEGVGPRKRFKLRFDLRGFRPEEVNVNLDGKHLQVYAQSSSHSPGRTCISQYHRDFHFPLGTDVDTIHTELSTDGILTVQANVPKWMRHHVT